jgi:PAS domain S-box-containing protein
VFDISDKALAEVYHQKDEELFREPGFQQYESLVQNRNGVLRTVMFYKTPHTRYDGKVIGLIGVIVDVTELKRTALELRESEERFRSIMDNIGIGVALISPKMEILTLNRTMLKWFPDLEFQKNPICYKAFNKPARKGPCEYCPTIKTFKDGLIHEAVTETPLGDEVVNYRVVASPVKNEKGEVTAVIEMVEDITEKNKNEQKLKMMNAEWDRTFNAISDFIFLQDKDGTVARVNSALAEFFKVKPEELVGKKCYEIMHNRNQPWPDCPMEQTKKDHKPHTIEVDDTNIGLPLLVTTISYLFRERGVSRHGAHIKRHITAEEYAGRTPEKDRYPRTFPGFDH